MGKNKRVKGKATREELLDFLEYVRSNHEFCLVDRECPECGRNHACDRDNDPCEGCQVYSEIAKICEYEGLC